MYKEIISLSFSPYNYYTCNILWTVYKPFGKRLSPMTDEQLQEMSRGSAASCYTF